MEVVTILGQELPIRLSPSFIGNAACPLLLKLRYIDKIETAYTRISAERGAAAHLAIAKLTDICVQEKMSPSRLADEQLRVAVAEATPHSIYAELGTIFSWVSLWRERTDLMLKFLVGFEERMAINLKYDEAPWDTADYRGIVDKIHIISKKKAIVTDYKSTPAIWAQTYLDAFEPGTFYCWLVWKFYPQIEEFIFRVNFLRYGFFRDTVRTKQQLQLYEQQLHVRRQKLREIVSWDPIPGEHCGLCDFVELCPLSQDTSELPQEIITPEQAVRVAHAVRVKEEWLKRGKAKLKSFVEHNNPVEFNGWAYGYKASPSKKYDKVLLERVCAEYGIPFTEVVNVNGKAMKKLEKRAEKEEGALLEELAAIATYDGKTQFKGYKLAGDDEGNDNAEEEG